MTDGLPSVDRSNISSDLLDYDSDCDSATPACSTYDRKTTSSYIYLPDSQSPSDYFDDVAQALFEVDLRPDINDFNGTYCNVAIGL